MKLARRDARPGRIKSAIIRWLRLDDAAGWHAHFGSPSAAGEHVTAELALRLSAVMACTRLVSQTVATLPLGLYERLPEGGRRLAEGHSASRLISARPNADMTGVVFWEGMVATALLCGNAFAEKKRSAGRVVSLVPLHFDRLSWRSVSGSRYAFTYIESDGRARELQEEDLFHLPGFTLGDRFGVSVIRYGSEVFGAALAANKAAASTFKNGLLPTTYFKMDRVLTPAQRAEFRENLKEITGALNAGKSPLLEGGMDTGTIGIDPSDAQLLESRQFSVEEVCRWFGVPPSMIGATDKASSWASSSENLNIWFLQYGLRPWLKRIEEQIKASLLTPAEQTRYYAEFTVEGLLRADTAARQSFYTSALQNGWMSRNDVRKLENLPPIPGGDIYTVQSNMVALDALGKVDQQSQAVRAALLHWLKGEEESA